MIIRKLIGCMFTALIFAFVIATREYTDDSNGFNFIEVIGFFLLFSSPFILVAGAPVSILSDKILKHQSGIGRTFKALAIHIFFGIFFGMILTYFLEGEIFFIFTVLASFIFWGVDELLQIFERKVIRAKTS